MRRAQGIFRTSDTPAPEFSDTLELDLATVEPSIAGPKRPQDRVPLRTREGVVEGGAGRLREGQARDRGGRACRSR